MYRYSGELLFTKRIGGKFYNESVFYKLSLVERSLIFHKLYALVLLRSTWEECEFTLLVCYTIDVVVLSAPYWLVTC